MGIRCESGTVGLAAVVIELGFGTDLTGVRMDEITKLSPFA
jgi:hypothetical protein